MVVVIVVVIATAAVDCISIEVMPKFCLKQY